MPGSRIRTLSLAVALVGWNGLVAPHLPPRWRVPVQAALGGVLVAVTDAQLGLRPPELWNGVRSGLAAAGVGSAAVASSTAVPLVRRRTSERELPTQLASWMLLRIPIGTVWSEEAAFRGALGTAAAQSFGPSWGRVVQAAAFGLSHVADARSAGEPVSATVAVTGAAGWAFGWLHDRSGSLTAPMLAHLAINEAGALVAVALRNRNGS